MFYYLYEIKNEINGKIYIGVHKTKNINDGYMGSSLMLKKAIDKYGIDNFTKNILEFFSNEKEMYQREKEIVNDEFLIREDVYNLRRGGNGGFDYINKNGLGGFKGRRHTEESKLRISKWSSERTMSQEARHKISNNSWAKRNPEEQKKHARKIVLERFEKYKQEQYKMEFETLKKKISESIKMAHKNGKFNYDHLRNRNRPSYNKGRRWIHKDEQQKMIPKDAPLPDGWKEKRK